MYHYRESGLPNVYLMNGYRRVKTPEGVGIAIEDVAGLHLTIARMLVEDKPVLTGREVRFVRHFLDLTQAEIAMLLGVEEQSVRRWEKLSRVPKQADHGIRLVFRDVTRLAAKTLAELMQEIEGATAQPEPVAIRYRFHPRAKSHWQPQGERAAA